MTRLELTSRQHATLSYAILLAFVAVFGWVVVRAPLAERLSFLARHETLSEVHGRSAALIAEEVARNEALALAPNDLPDGAFLRGETAALAGAELQNRIRQIVEAQDALLVSSAFRQGGEPQPLTPITVQVRARSSVPALQRILLALEQETSYLFFETLTVQSRHRDGRALRATNEELDVDFEVTGYVNRPYEP